MIRWWMDKGVKGFPLDVIDQITKEPDQKILANGPRLHEFLREMNRPFSDNSTYSFWQYAECQEPSCDCY